MTDIPQAIAAVEAALAAYLPYKTALSPAPAYALTRAVEKHIPALLAAAKESASLKSDVDHAVKEAMRRQPEYPWLEKTASEAVWALGEALAGADAALENRWAEIKQLERESASKDAEIERLREPVADTYCCQRCGRRDGLDAVVPNEIWATITEGTLKTVEVVDGKWNLLCLWCIDELCGQHGVKCSASLHFAGNHIFGTSQSDADTEHVSRLAAEIERLRTDAERYQVCRQNAYSNLNGLVRVTIKTDLVFGCGNSGGECLDAAIDAALSGRPPSE